jgi:hypothetical protein
MRGPSIQDRQRAGGLRADVVGQRRRQRRLDVADRVDVDEIEDRQQHARQERGEEHVADRFAQQVGHDDQHDAGRNQNAERTDSTHGTGGQFRLVTLLQHDR